MRFTKIHIVVLALLSFVLIAAEDGVGEDQNKDRSGSPDGANLCSHCHDSGSFSPEISLKILNSDDEEVTEYIAGETYLLNYEVVSTVSSALVYGFQGTALNGENVNMGTFSDPGVQTQIETVSNINVSNRVVVEHSSPSASGSWEVMWTAPSENTDDVKFYFSGVAANGNGMSTGDGFGGGSLILREDTDASVSDRVLKDLWKLSRTDEGYKLVSIVGSSTAAVAINVYSITGSLISSNEFIASEINLYSKDLSKGINIISIMSNKNPEQFQVYF